jgi:hypothetical protein
VSGYLTFEAGSYLRGPLSGDLTECTIEFFANVNTVTLQRLLAFSGGLFTVFLHIEDGDLILGKVGSGFLDTVTCKLPNELLNSWHHYAVCIDEITFTLYIDGTEILTAVLSGISTSTEISIGGGDAPSFTGQLTNFRISTNILYPGRVPSVPLSAGNSVLLLLVYPEGPTVDSSPVGVQLNEVGTILFNKGPIEVAPAIFSDYGILNFDGNSYLEINVDPSLFDDGTADFRIDWYMNPTDSEDMDILSWYSDECVFECSIYESKLIVLFGNNSYGGPLPFEGYPGVECPITFNKWEHYTIYRRSNEIRVLINGIKVGSFLVEPTQVIGDEFYIGAANRNDFVGSITNLRLDVELGRTILPLSGGILLFLATPYYPFKNSGSSGAVNNSGVTSAIGPIDIPLNKSYNVFTDFSYTNYISSTLTPGSGDFTIECFFRYSVDGYIWTFYKDPLLPYLQLYVVDGKLDVDSSFLNETITIGTVDFDTWYHCAVTRYKNNWYGTLNGSTSFLATGTLNLGNIGLTIGDLSPGLGYYLVGAISNFHYVKRALYYTDSVIEVIPTQPIQSVIDTQLLLLAKPGAPFKDSSGNQNGTIGRCAVIPGPLNFSQFMDYNIFTGFSETKHLIYQVNPGTSDFTVDFFFNCISVGNLWSFEKPDGTYLSMDIFDEVLYVGSPVVAGPVSGVVLNRWYYVALTRSGNSWYATLNGTTIFLDEELLDLRGTQLFIGYLPGSTPFDGSISNFRYTSRALYSDETSTIPSLPLTVIPDTQLLLLAKPGKAFNDSSIYNRAVTGSCTITPGPFDPFSNLSESYNILTGFSPATYLFYPFLVPIGDFTIECFFKTSVVSTIRQRLWGFTDISLTNPSIRIDIRNGILRFQYTRDNTPWSASVFETVVDTWYHFLVTRSGNEFYLFVNGGLVRTLNIDTDFSPYYLSIGNIDGAPDYPLDGYISNFRYVTQALYTDSFVIPTPPLEAIDGTTLLLLAKPGESFKDSSEFNRIPSGKCAVVSGPIDPPETRYGILKFSDDQYITYTIDPDTSNFTVEFFFKTSESLTPLWCFGDGIQLVGNYIRDSSLYVEASNGISQIVGTIEPDTWYYYALTRSGNDWYTTVDNTTVLVGTGSLDLTGTRLYIGYFPGYGFFQGSISNFRFVKNDLNKPLLIPIPPLENVGDTELLLLARPGQVLEDSSNNPKTVSGSSGWGPGPIR